MHTYTNVPLALKEVLFEVDDEKDSPKPALNAMNGCHSQSALDLLVQRMVGQSVE